MPVDKFGGGGAGGSGGGAQFSTAGLVQKTGDVMLGSLSAGGFRITSVGAPTENTDAATREYADTIDQDNLQLGGGTMRGDINMGGHRVTGLPNGLPGSDSDATSWDQVRNHVTEKLSGYMALHVAKTGDTMTGDLTMGGHRLKGLPTGLPGSNSDATSWGQTVRLVTDATTNNPAVPEGPLHLTNKRYVDDQDALRVAKTGDTMTGDLRLIGGEDEERLLGCTELAAGKTFALVLGNMKNRLCYTFPSSQYHLNPVLLNTADGFQIRVDKSDLFYFGASGARFSTDIGMRGNNISGLKDPTDPQDATTKAYVDAATKEYLSYDGHIPPLTSNRSKTGFFSTASSVQSAYFQAFMAFSPHLPISPNRNFWMAARSGAGSWLQIKCPAPVRIWKIRLSGYADRITRWNLLGGNIDGGPYTNLLTSDVALTMTAQEFLVDIPAGVSYTIYRLEVLAAAMMRDKSEFMQNPGISHCQIFTRNI